MTRRIMFGVAALLLLLVAWKLPTAWYDSLPRQPDTPPLPFRGVSLLRITFALEAIALVWFAIGRWKYSSLPQSQLLSVSRRGDPPSDLSRSTAGVMVAVITFVGLILRVYNIGSDLWLDEISPIVDYGRMPFVQVIGSYLRTNNHLLNTILIKLTIAAFGESEWSVRLPAMLFGAATIPVFYWLARVVLSRWASVASAAVLAVSYHHIFFSQNARGYSGYILFALLSSRLLISALSDDKAWRWILYVVAVVLGFASLAHTAFVFAAHVIIGAATAFQIRRRGDSAAPLVRRLFMVFGAAGFFSLQLYAAPLPEMYAVITHFYVRKGTGYAPFSMEFMHELARGTSAGFGGIVPAAIAAVIGTAGLIYLFRRNWLVTCALGLPPILTAIFLIVRGLSFSPRFFLLLIPLGILTILSLAESRDKPRRAALVGGLLCVASLVSLVTYYRIPKQSYRSAIRYLEESREPNEKILIVYVAEVGIRYYLRRSGAQDTAAYEYAATQQRFDSLLAESSPKFLVTTLPRILNADLPGVYQRIARDWRPREVFPATIGDGQITVWERK